ncbi:MAG: alpha/beta hydrolase [Verrucomicrobiae bacterium]|nr:alpha/beta hydrolase [Verrucomicrobiae bacterium]
MSRSLVATLCVFFTLASLHSAPARPETAKGRGQAQARRMPMPRPAPPGFKLVLNQDYGGAGNPRQMLDLYLPVEPDNRPLVVWIHGGGWKNGSKENLPMMWLLEKGYALASINYRLSDEAKFPAQSHDCKGAIRWLRANAKRFGYNATKIGIAGSSAGGHLVALLGVSGGVKEIEGTVGGNLDQSSRVQAVIDLYGPTDFLSMVDQPSRMDRSGPDCPEALLIGGTVKENVEKARAASPSTYVSNDDPPHLIYQGDKDPLVPWKQSTSFHELLKKAGVNSELVMIKGGEHGGPAFTRDAKAVETQLAFFDRYLK